MLPLPPRRVLVPNLLGKNEIESGSREKNLVNIEIGQQILERLFRRRQAWKGNFRRDENSCVGPRPLVYGPILSQTDHARRRPQRNSSDYLIARSRDKQSKRRHSRSH